METAFRTALQTLLQANLPTLSSPDVPDTPGFRPALARPWPGRQPTFHRATALSGQSARPSSAPLRCRGPDETAVRNRAPRQWWLDAGSWCGPVRVEVGAGDERAIAAGVEERHLRVASDVALEFDEVAAKIELRLDLVAAPVPHPVFGDAGCRAEVAVLPTGVGLAAGKGEVGAEQGDARRAHFHRKVNGRVDDAAAHMQCGPGNLRAQPGVQRTGGIACVARPLPPFEHGNVLAGQIHQRNAGRIVGGQVPRGDAMVDGDNDIDLDALVAQRHVGGVDADDQRPLGACGGLQEARQVLLKTRSRGDDEHVAPRLGSEQRSDISVALQQVPALLQQARVVRRVCGKRLIVEADVDLADQAITDACAGVISEHQLGGQGEKWQLDFVADVGIGQGHSRVRQPVVLIQQLQHQCAQRTVEDMDMQALQRRVRQHHPLQIPQRRAVNMHHRAVDRKTVRLGQRFGEAVMATGELNTVDAQGRFTTFQQLRGNGPGVFAAQSLGHVRPALLDDSEVVLKYLAQDGNPFPDRRAPRQAHAEAADCDAFPAGVHHMLFKQQRNAGGHRVAGFEHVLDELLRRLAVLETTGDRIDNGGAALVDAERVDVSGLQAGVRQQFVEVRRHFDQSEVEHLTAVHVEGAVGGLEEFRARAVGAELGFAQLPWGVVAVDVTRAAQGNIERGDVGGQAQLMLHDGGRVRQALFVAVLGDDNQRVDGIPRQRRVVGEQLVDRFDTQVGGFLGIVFARQKSGTDLAKDEVFILSEFGTLGAPVLRCVSSFLTDHFPIQRGAAFQGVACLAPQHGVDVLGCQAQAGANRSDVVCAESLAFGDVPHHIERASHQVFATRCPGRAHAFIQFGDAGHAGGNDHRLAGGRDLANQRDIGVLETGDLVGRHV
nr:hypothetical protein [Tanacetum cinerariifolium]